MAHPPLRSQAALVLANHGKFASLIGPKALMSSQKSRTQQSILREPPADEACDVVTLSSSQNVTEAEDSAAHQVA